MAKAKMQCYYEVLDCERDADDDTLKKSYRKLALRYHPDKNIANEEAAKQKFQLIQQAWEVLSDPQERAWYDRHRDQILKGNQSNYEDDSLDIFPFFTTSCYKGFGDDDEGFYKVYRQVFEKLAAEDIEYMEDPDEFATIPKFGDSTSNFEDVTLFYGFWESYSTKKSYAWLFTHNINEIRDRRILKLVDKEHKKIQQKARKERNEEVRSLVLFVKKRDKRMVEYRKMLEEKAQQNRIKSQQNRLEQMKRQSELQKGQQNNTQLAKEHEEQLRELQESYLNQYSGSDDDEEDSSDVDDVQEGVENCELSGEEDVFNDDLYCVACNKFFNSDSSKLNHEGSKKHRQNIELLKAEMNAEEEKFQENVEEENLVVAEESVEDDEDETEPVVKLKGKKSKKKNKKNFNFDEEVVKDESSDEKQEEAPVLETKLIESDNEDDWSSNKKAKKTKVKGKSKIEKPKPVEPVEEKIVEPTIEPKVTEDETSTEPDLRCATCKEIFSSKNKLFNHLKKTNHSIYLGEVKTKVAEKSSSKKKK